MKKKKQDDFIYYWEQEEEPEVFSDEEEMEIIESDGGMIIEISMPGFRKSDIEVSMSRNGVIKVEASKKERKGIITFCQSFSVPASIKNSKIEAKYSGGILKIDVVTKKNDRKIRIK